ncbi:hypothetical protein [Draconibacterium mangrovi]|uniref:hypothetical protein n=1 Tax=Draconibacterium mangrovi TaxID=2697469 RepID=UPI0013CFE8B1|nr:hypothetical protein [Draconibacterium mangrovi]
MGALSVEQMALVEALVKEQQDYTRANIINAWLMKFGVTEAVAGDNVISFSDDGVDVTRDDPYDDTSYIIDVIEAQTADGVDVRDELEILDENKTVNGFVINCLQPCTIKWQTSRRTPKVEFFT